MLDPLAGLAIEEMELLGVDRKRQAVTGLGMLGAGEARLQQAAIAQAAMDDGVGAEHLGELDGDAERRSGAVDGEMLGPDAQRERTARRPSISMSR